MNHICAKLFILFTLLIFVSSVSPVFVASDKYVKTGVFYIASSQFLTDLITNGYSVQFSNCAVSSDVYKVGLGLYSLNMNFNNVTLMFDLQVSSTSVTGFNITFSTTMATFISLMKVCYIVKNPSYTDVFYVQNYRYTGPGFVVTKTGNSSYSQLYNLTTPIPTSSMSSLALNVIPFLYAFNFQSTVSGVLNNIDIYPNLVIVDQNTVQFMMQTLYDDVKVAYYSFSAVIYDGVQVWNAGKSLFTFGVTLSSYSSIDLYYSSLPAQMLQTSTFIGLKAFHVCTKQTPNFINFETTFPNNSYVTFPSRNDINWGYMEFQILVIEATACPVSAPYYIYYLNDCQTTIPVGYVKNCQGNIVINLQMNLNYIIKNPSQNQVEFMFNLEPSDPSLSTLLSQVDWNNALQIDFPGTKNAQFISSPYPQLKLTVDYTGNLQSLQKTMTISAYNSALFPVNFAGFTQTSVSLPMTSLNNMNLNFYDDSVYTSAKGISIVCIILSVLVMILFLVGLVAGKIYILQMAFVFQVTFLSLVSLRNITPTMSGLSYLRYVFGYFVTANDGNVYSQQPRNYMKLIGISDYFLLNFNIMFIFFILSFVLGIVFHFKEKFKARRFFLLETPLYLVLWFGMWIWCTGQIQIRQFTIYHESNPLAICGVLFFIICLIMIIGYFVLYIIKNSDIDSFYSIFNSPTRTQTQNSIWSKAKYFYVILFAQRILLGILFAHAYSFICLNIILIVIHLVVIVLIVIFKPYKLRNIDMLPQLQKEKKFNIPPLLRANIRQILNYSLLVLILIFLFITNQIQQSPFSIYIPVIVIIFLFIVIILTVLFLIFDNRLKEDFEEFKKIFDNYEQPRKQETVVQHLNSTDKKVTEDDIVIDLVDDPVSKYNLMPQKSVDPFEMSFSPKKSPRRNQNDNKYSFGQNQRNNPSIDQQPMKIAENKQSMYRKNKAAGFIDPQISNSNGSRFKNYHQAMKGITPNNGNNGLRESNSPNNPRNLKNFPFAFDDEE